MEQKIDMLERQKDSDSSVLRTGENVEGAEPVDRLRSVRSQEGDVIGSTVHLFERAGLGKAPFIFCGVETKTFKAHPDAPTQPGDSCDYCGTGIIYCFHIRSADGKEFVVGSDCVAKTDDAGLRKIVDAKVRQLKCEATHKRQDARIEAAKALLPKVADQLAKEPRPLDWKPQNTLLDTVEWYFTNAGRSGQCWAAKIIEKAAKG